MMTLRGIDLDIASERLYDDLKRSQENGELLADQLKVIKACLEEVFEDGKLQGSIEERKGKL